MEVDVDRSVNAVTRTVRSFSKDGKPAVAVTLSRSYDTDVQQLWDAVTNPGRLAQWFSPVSGDLRQGGQFQVEHNASGTITTCETPSEGSGRFAATWEFGGSVSWIDVQVEKEGNGARLTLEHIGPEEGDHWEQYGPAAGGIGWDMGLVGLDSHLGAVSTGASFDLQEGMEWMGSDNGKDFIRASGKAWGAAHVAGGEDRTRAEGMAAQSIAAYTGEGAS